MVGVDHEELGQEVKAIVVLRPGAGASTAQLGAWVGAALAAFKVPAHCELRARAAAAQRHRQGAEERAHRRGRESVRRRVVHFSPTRTVRQREEDDRWREWRSRAAATPASSACASCSSRAFESGAELGAGLNVVRRRARGDRPLGRLRGHETARARGGATRSRTCTRRRRASPRSRAPARRARRARARCARRALLARVRASGQGGDSGAHAAHRTGRARRGREAARCPTDIFDWTTMTSALARQAPWWKPGTKHGYHALTYGWLVGELIRRVSGHERRPLRARAHRGAARRGVLDRPAGGARRARGGAHAGPDLDRRGRRTCSRSSRRIPRACSPRRSGTRRS